MKTMRLRAAHLVCFFLLLSSAGAADASALRGADLGLANRYAGVLLLQNAAVSRADSPLDRALGRALETRSEALISTPVLVRAVWTMRPPAEQSAHVHAVTSSIA